MSALIYPVLLIAGFVGLIVMAAMGFLHAPGHHGGDGHGHHGLDAHAGGGHGHGHLGPGHGLDVHAGHGGHGGHGGHHGHAHGGQHGQGGHHHDNPNAHSNANSGSNTTNALLWVMPFLSPLNWFSWMLGGGAAGSLAVSLWKLPEPWTALIAVAGAILLNQGVVKPVWKLVFSFASPPARNLEGCMLQTVEAVTGFNERGEGLVRVTIDGHSEDVLARLTPEEIAQGGRVRRGDLLMIEEVDPQKNTCRVSRA